jgi:ribosomal protein RSM22 (predicted rRNA methylase)
MAERLPGVARNRVAESMSRRYRDVDRSVPARTALATADDVVAYAVTRMPATYASARAAFGALALSGAAGPDGAVFTPRTVLDLGGGLGAAAYAAARTWPDIEEVVVVDSQPIVLATGRELHDRIGLAAPRMRWERLDLDPTAGSRPHFDRADLVTISYLLSELSPPARRSIVEAACAASRSAVVVIEPGTPSGYVRIIDARSAIISAGLEIAAPCPHGLECPLTGGDDWCHFSVRLARTKAHRTAKSGRLGYEDEKFSYVAAVRRPPSAGGDRPARIIRHPIWRKSLVELQLCMPDESAVTTTRVPRSAGPLYTAARASSWGDVWPLGGETGDS